jgi:ketosteroid isomerase-like protein
MSTPPPLLSEGEIGLSSTAAKDVLEHHGAAVLSGDIDAVMEDYTDDSVFISNIGGVLRGVNAIRPVFEMGRD